MCIRDRLSHSSGHLQRAVQHKDAFTQEHCRRQPFLQPQRTSSWQEPITSGSVLQQGLHKPPSKVQPQSCGFGIVGHGIKACPQMYPACKTARLECSNRAALVGGMASNCLPFFTNRCFRAPLTVVCALVLSYSKTTKRYKVAMHESSTTGGVFPNKRKVDVASGKDFHVSIAVFLPFP